MQVDDKNAPHVGGNTWAGGTGGRDTAGLGGKGGPYRLDAGHDVHQLSDEEKNNIPDEVRKQYLVCAQWCQYISSLMKRRTTFLMKYVSNI